MLSLALLANGGCMTSNPGAPGAEACLMWPNNPCRCAFGASLHAYPFGHIACLGNCWSHAFQDRQTLKACYSTTVTCPGT